MNTVMSLVKEAWSALVNQQDFYSALSPITWACRIAGIFPLVLDGSVSKRKYSMSYVVMIYSLCILVCTTASLYAWTDHTNERCMRISQYAVVLISIHFELILTVISVVVMIVTSIIGKDKLANAIHSLSLQDVLLQKLGTKLDYATDSKQNSIRLGIITFTIIVLSTFDFAYQFNFNMRYPLNWISWLFPNIIRIMNACLFVDILIIVKQRFGALNKHLERMIEETKNSQVMMISTSEYVCSKIRSIASIHGAMCEIAISVNQTFDCNIIVGVIYAFIILTASLYHIFEEIKDPNCDYLQILGFSNWGIMNCCPMIYIIIACHLTQSQATLTGKLIHKLQISADDIPLNNVIQSFSLQLHHQKIKFSGAGLFPLDSTFIQSIVGAVTTYLVILIQFDSSTTQVITLNGTNESLT